MKQIVEKELIEYCNLAERYGGGGERVNGQMQYNMACLPGRALLQYADEKGEERSIHIQSDLLNTRTLRLISACTE